MRKIIAILISVIVVFGAISPMTAYASEMSDYPEFNCYYRNWVTPVKNQGSLGCCWAFAAVSCLESYMLSHPKFGFDKDNVPDFSEAWFAWYAMHNSTSNPYNVAAGDQDIIQALSNGFAVASEKDFPYYADDISKMGNYSAEDEFKAFPYLLDSAVYLYEEKEIKRWLTVNGSALCMFTVPNGSSFTNQNNKDISFCNESKSVKGLSHMVTVVGWNDNYSKDNFKNKPERDGAWLCKNSWGEKWGDRGYFWLSYDEPTRHTMVGLTLSKLVNFDKLISYNEGTYNSFISAGHHLKVANVFNLKAGDEIYGYSDYRFNEVKTKITVYKLYSDAENVTDGDIVVGGYYEDVKRNGFYMNGGGYGGYKVTQDGKYSVVIEMTGENCIYPMEKYNMGSTPMGQSYVDFGNGWQDAGDNNFYINMYIDSAEIERPAFDDPAFPQPTDFDNQNPDNPDEPEAENWFVSLWKQIKSFFQMIIEFFQSLFAKQG